MQEKTKKKSLVFLIVEACPSYLGTSGKNTHSSLKHFSHFRRCGRGILKGAAFRQRPLSRLLINFLAGTRKLPPEGTALKYSVRVGQHAQIFISGR